MTAYAIGQEFGTRSVRAVVVDAAIVLDAVVRLAMPSRSLDPGLAPLIPPLLNRQCLRRHGTDAYCGQP